MFKRGHESIKRVLTEIVGLDWLLGGGVPLGRIMEVFGAEGSGKTTLAAEIAKAFQQEGKRVLYLDYEHSVDVDWFKKIGVDVSAESDLWLYDQPFCLEDGSDAIKDLAMTGEVGLILVDSVPAMVPKAELEGKAASQNIALQARCLSKMYRNIVGPLESTGTTAIFINQVRDKIGAPYPVDTTPGGRSIRFYSSVRMQLKQTGPNRDHRVKLIKNKTCEIANAMVPFEIGSQGVDRMSHLKACAFLTVLENRSGSYFLGDKRLCRGPSELNKYLSSKLNQHRMKQLIMDFWSTQSNGQEMEITEVIE